MSKYKTIMNRLKQDYDMLNEKGHEVVGVFLQGSQNYELDSDGSDIDTKAILLPKFDNFLFNSKPISTTIELDPSKEHIDIKDIRLMFNTFKKQNINFIEILFTKYKFINSKYKKLFQLMIDNRERIARYDIYRALNCIVGMSAEKYKALCHPYPSIKEKVEKFGYDNKQLHHIIRLNEFIKRYIHGESYENCLISKNKKHLVDVKSSYIYSLDSAREIADKYNKETYKIKQDYIDNTDNIIDKDVELLMNNVLSSIIKQYFKEELNKR